MSGAQVRAAGLCARWSQARPWEWRVAADALSENVVHACRDFLQGVLVLRFFKRFEKHLLFVGACGKKLVFHFEVLRQRIEFRDAGRRPLSAAQSLGQMRALAELSVTGGEA